MKPEDKEKIRETVNEDARENIKELNQIFVHLEKKPQDVEAMGKAERHLHNLKGLGSVVGEQEIVDLAHRMESTVSQAREKKRALDAKQCDELFHSVDAISTLFEKSVGIEDAPLHTAQKDGDEVENFDWSAMIPDFIDSARDNIKSISNGILKLEKNPKDKNAVEEIFRSAHSLKGSASIIDMKKIVSIAHLMEEILREFHEGTKFPTTDIIDILFEALDIINTILDCMAEGGKERIEIESVLNKLTSISGEKPVTEKTHIKESIETGPVLNKPVSTYEEQSGSKEKPTKEIMDDRPSPPPSDISIATPKANETVRVSTNKLDDILNLVGELVIGKIRLEDERLKLSSLQLLMEDELKRLGSSSISVTEDLQGKSEEEQGEILGPTNEAVNFCHRFYERLEKFSVGFDSSIENINRLINEIQGKIMGIRMLPISTIFDTFPRAVRDMAKGLHKEVDLQIEGGDTQIDKKILEEMSDPLVHLVRNAIDHGIESPKDRIMKGKPTEGILKLSAYQQAGRIVVEVEDDGCGIDPEEIRKTALKKKFLQSQEIEKMDEDDLISLIFHPGFSTKTIITDVSGRGIGMDVVKTNIDKLHGSIDLSSKPGIGTKISLSLPLTLATTRALMVRVEEQTLAIPINSVEKTMRMSQDEVRSVGGRDAIMVDGHIIPITSMSSVLGWNSNGKDQSVDSKLQAVILFFGSRRVAFNVDDLIGELEIVVKTMGSHLIKVGNFAGSTILGSGDVVLIIDVPQLITSARVSEGIVAPRGIMAEAIKEEEEVSQTILAVDDQMTIRQLEKSILETAGYNVETAEDGIEALRILSERHVDLVVTDVLMPRMDGFTLTENIKGDEKYKDIPVVIVTSLEKDEDKMRGVKAGANAYIVKGNFQQGNLIDTIKSLIG